MKKRNDYCFILSEIVGNFSIDENEYSNEMITGIIVKSI